jgi:hypothetical protein
LPGVLLPYENYIETKRSEDMLLYKRTDWRMAVFKEVGVALTS